jgi:N-methylhydantoinase A
VQLLESGPAAGALAGAWFGRNAGLERVLAFDMGGTTAKLALVDDGIPLVAWGFEAARAKRFLRGSGLPIQIATVELIEIGAGGGSIARRSELGTLHVGPDSAGAVPGPACYGRGGDTATVTDADLLLGYLNADFFLGGAMQIDLAAAEAAVGTLADHLGIPAIRAAYGIHDVVNENMAGAARVAIAERGRIPHEYALMATGGAAPVHAWQVARKLGVKRLVCPPGAGVGSTIGMLMAPARVDRVTSLNVPLARADWGEIAAIFARLRAGAEVVVAATGAVLAEASAQRRADMRYVGQGSEITVRDVVPRVVRAHTTGGGHPVRGAAVSAVSANGGEWGTVTARTQCWRRAEGDACRVVSRGGWVGGDGGVQPLRAADRRCGRGTGGVRGDREHVGDWSGRVGNGAG